MRQLPLTPPNCLWEAFRTRRYLDAGPGVRYWQRLAQSAGLLVGSESWAR